MLFLRKHFIISIVCLLCGCVSLCAQVHTDTLAVYFRQGHSTFDRNYRNNGERYDAFISRIKAVQDSSRLEITKVEFVAATSPEGSDELNANLARKRSANLTALLHNDLQFRDSLVNTIINPNDWERLAAMVVADPLVPERDNVLTILAEATPERKSNLRNLSQGAPWNYLLKNHFPDLRSFRVNVFIGELASIPQLCDLQPVDIPDEPLIEMEQDFEPLDNEPLILAPMPVSSAEEEPAEESLPERRLLLKSNLIGWGFLMANAAVEIDVAEHWTFTLPIYYSAWNYFRTTIKFRTFAVQPEFRYWISERNDGFFAGAHFGMAYYNFAFDGPYRYQDHFRETPAVGGGLSIGYRLPISRNDRWRVEFSVGAGVYALHYDKFHNTPETKYGLMIESIRDTYWGLDQASVTFSYSFDLKKKGGKR